MKPKLCILGAGAWGTALASSFRDKFEVSLWHRGPAHPAVLLPSAQLTNNISEACSGAHVVLLAVPSQAFRRVLSNAAGVIDRDATIVSAAKGIETLTLLRMSEVAGEILPGQTVAVLSGPSFAREIVRGEPAALVIASARQSAAQALQQDFSTRLLRFYVTGDVVGVELAGALKNVIAIAAGICSGLGLGSNTVAALITRGLAEMTRLAMAHGAQERTLAGLAGLGDLVLTATGELSRNRRVGVELAGGKMLREILVELGAVAEGVEGARAAHQMAHRSGVEMPIVQAMYEVLWDNKAPRLALEELMQRPLRGE